MTTLFKKIFGSAKEVTTPQLPTIPEAATGPVKELFVEERHPTEFLAPDPPQRRKREKTILEDLLAIDYAALGQKEGYEQHDLSKLDMQLDLLVSDFRLAFDRALQDIEVELEPLGIHLTDRVKEETPELFAKIRVRQEQLIKQRSELLTQKDLAVTGEGFIEKPYRYYKSGFRRGYDLYVEEQLIFKHIKTL